jgi:hypothetical protein
MPKQPKTRCRVSHRALDSTDNLAAASAWLLLQTGAFVANTGAATFFRLLVSFVGQLSCAAIAAGWKLCTNVSEVLCFQVCYPGCLAAGMLICDYELKLGWGKAVPLPAQALPAPPAGASAQSMLAGVRPLTPLCSHSAPVLSCSIWSSNQALHLHSTRWMQYSATTQLGHLCTLVVLSGKLSDATVLLLMFLLPARPQAVAIPCPVGISGIALEALADLVAAVPPCFLVLTFPSLVSCPGGVHPPSCGHPPHCGGGHRQGGCCSR